VTPTDAPSIRFTGCPKLRDAVQLTQNMLINTLDLGLRQNKMRNNTLAKVPGSNLFRSYPDTLRPEAEKEFKSIEDSVQEYLGTGNTAKDLANDWKASDPEQMNSGDISKPIAISIAYCLQAKKNGLKTANYDDAWLAWGEAERYRGIATGIAMRLHIPTIYHRTQGAMQENKNQADRAKIHAEKLIVIYFSNNPSKSKCDVLDAIKDELYSYCESESLRKYIGTSPKGINRDAEKLRVTIDKWFTSGEIKKIADHVKGNKPI